MKPVGAFAVGCQGPTRLAAGAFSGVFRIVLGVWWDFWRKILRVLFWRGSSGIFVWGCVGWKEFFAKVTCFVYVKEEWLTDFPGHICVSCGSGGVVENLCIHY